jgi:hypothetical protein
MDNKLREDIVLNLTNNKSFEELVNLLKTNKNIILNNIINNKFLNIVSIIKKIDYNIINIKNLSDDDIIFINDLIKDKTNALTILLEIKKKKKEIYNYVHTINIIYCIILFVIISIYLYLIYDLFFVNKTKTNIQTYLNFTNFLSYVLILTLILSLKNTIITIYNNRSAIYNSLFKLPLFVYILILKIILSYILENHTLIFKLSNDNWNIIIICIIILIVVIGLYDLYYNYINNSKENYTTNIDLSVYIFDNYGKKYLNLIYNFINDNLYTEPIT